MQTKLGTLAALSITALLALSTSANGALLVTEAMPGSDNATNTPADYDWWELTNNGATSVVLTNWGWDDDASFPAGAAVFSIGALTIGAGESIVFIEGPDETTWRNLWNLPGGVNVINTAELTGGFSGLSQSGDLINLFRSNGTIETGVTFGAANAGISFEWSGINGTSLGLSVVGENSAFAAPNDIAGVADVGSPGIALLPEPASAALLGIGVAFLLSGRRPRR